MVTHSSVLAWRIPGTGSLVGCCLWVAQSRTRLKRLSSSSSALMDEDRVLCKLPDGRGWLWEKLGLALVGKAMFSKSLIQFSAEG